MSEIINGDFSIFPLTVEDDDLLDSRGYIIAEFCCETWEQEQVGKALVRAACEFWYDDMPNPSDDAIELHDKVVKLLKELK
jgi:hypothetical protein